jgi:hypothetical protein
MPAAEPIYVEARRVLLDALFALAPHGPAVIVAGAQAVYLHTGDADLAVAPYTTDGDIALDPALLGRSPQLEIAMEGAGFRLDPDGRQVEPGSWLAPARIAGEGDLVPVDLIVPDAVADVRGRRAARLDVHGDRAARKARGLEAALIDHRRMTVEALDPADARSIDAEVAGPAALLVAKAHKIADRVASGRDDRMEIKDAADVFRLMQTTRPAEVGATLVALRDDKIAGEVTAEALAYLDALFGRRGRAGIEMAGRALRAGVSPARIEAVCVAYLARMLDAVGTSAPTAISRK